MDENRIFLPSVGTVYMHWLDKYKDLGLPLSLCDVTEPVCPVCGRVVRSVLDINYNKYETMLACNDLRGIWDSAKLIVHSIVPESLGGTDELDNLFVLCTRCHLSAPVSSSKDAFFNWARNIKPIVLSFNFNDEVLSKIK